MCAFPLWLAAAAGALVHRTSCLVEPSVGGGLGGVGRVKGFVLGLLQQLRFCARMPVRLHLRMSPPSVWSWH
jgi:hypothetical protein